MPKKAAVGAMVKSTDVASLARSFQAVKVKLADTEARLEKERREREGDADTIAEMLVRIVALERNLRDAAAASARARESRPPEGEALRRIAGLEGRANEAEARARNAEARASEAEARALTESERAETLARDLDALRGKLADAEVRARSEHDRAAHADEVARAARARAIELTERLELAGPATPSRDLGAELRKERERHQRELEDVQQRNAAALRDAHDAYADAFRQTLEDEREVAREELEQERARHREAAARITELEDLLRAAESKHEDASAEIERLTFDRDAADRQSRLAAIQLDAAQAKLQLVDKQLEWAEEMAAVVRGSKPTDLGPVLSTLLERVAAARTALFVDDSPVPEKTKPDRRRSTRPPRRS